MRGGALLEAVRHPWLSLGRPLAHWGIVLACVAGLLSGRLGWQERPVILSVGQGYKLRHRPEVTLRLEDVGLARGSSELYSWVGLLRGEQMLCRGVVSSARGLSCEGVHVQQARAEPAIRIAGHDRAGHPLALQGSRGEETMPELILPFPSSSSPRSVALPEGKLFLHIEAPPDRAGFQVEVRRVRQSAPLLRREITDSVSLSLDDLTLTLDPTRVPSFQLHHHPTRPLRWAGLSLALSGLLMSLASSIFHSWARVEEREDGVHLRLWQSLTMPFCVPAIRELKSQLDFSASG
ncbi:MAG: hypothetical protein U9Q78_01295 [Chloroflexota bacterium]|nr:hypothetical protein [Chloroflexota bacterium]